MDDIKFMKDSLKNYLKLFKMNKCGNIACKSILICCAYNVKLQKGI